MPVLLFALFLALPPGQSVHGRMQTGPVSPVTLPVLTSEGYLVHEAYFNDEGPFWVVLDTGNQGTIVFQRVADRVGLVTEEHGEMGGAGPGSVTVRRAEGLVVALRGDGGEVAFEEDEVLVLPDEAGLPPFEGKRIDAFLGATLIERQVVSIDYPNGRLTLHRSSSTYRPHAGAREMRIGLVQGYPYVEGSLTPLLHGEPVAPVEGRFHLDLGAAYGVELEHAVAKELGLLDSDDPAQRPEGQMMGIDGVLMDVRSGPVTGVAMGGVELATERAILPPVQGGGPPIEGLVGNLGSGSFRGGVLVLDYARQRALLEPSPEDEATSEE